MYKVIKKQKQLVKLTSEDKALQLFKVRAVSRISDDLYHVRSQKDPDLAYEVIPSINVCTCVDLREEAWLAYNF